MVSNLDLLYSISKCRGWAQEDAPCALAGVSIAGEMLLRYVFEVPR